MDATVLVIGVGVSKHGDSSAGKWVVKRLMGKTAPGVRLMEQVSDPAFLLDSWRGFPAVVLAGAVHSGAKPGTLFRLEAHKRPLPPFFLSKKTHLLPVFEAIERARAEGTLPERLLVYGIEGKRFKEGDKMVEDVKEATHKVAERVLLDLHRLLEPSVVR
jgi:hydrogenase maturation protease